jgi:SEC-C motif-containing protein
MPDIFTSDMTAPANETTYLGKPCPCGSGKNFEACCGPLIDGSQPAATAEALMRSRFTAHVIQAHRYLHETYAGTRGKPFVDEPDPAPVQWTRLVIHSHEPEVKPGTSQVDFSAFYQENGAELVLQEKSEFQKLDGKWIYTRTVRMGPAPAKAAPKVGRNDPCPCGSGKKYKHCHLGKAA